MLDLEDLEKGWSIIRIIERGYLAQNTILTASPINNYKMVILTKKIFYEEENK